MTSPKMNINVYLQVTGHHESAWRLPEAPINATYDIDYWISMAKTAERGKLDSIFFGDTASLPLGDIRYRPGGRMSPMLILSAIAVATKDIGLIATASTTFNEPFNIARSFATLDHISNGRAGWNMVTSADDASARNFGLDNMPEHSTRYGRAEEFVQVVKKLWDSWEDDFLVGDKEAGVYADGDKINAIDHVGEYFQVAGPLNMPRPPQGHPVLVQAGSSPDGRKFAANHAEAVFTAMQTFPDAKDFYSDIKERVRANGRSAETVRVLPGIVPFIGSTEAEARALEDELGQWTQMQSGLAQLSGFLNLTINLDQLEVPLLEAVGEDYASTTGAKNSRAQLILEMATRENLTVRGTLMHLAAGRGHQVVSGTPEMIADYMETWFKEGAADGFNLLPPTLPGSLELFVDHVVPILQERGLFRKSYAPGTLREKMGLERP